MNFNGSRVKYANEDHPTTALSRCRKTAWLTAEVPCGKRRRPHGGRACRTEARVNFIGLIGLMSERNGELVSRRGRARNVAN
jgi:hypothetical protein